MQRAESLYVHLDQRPLRVVAAQQINRVLESAPGSAHLSDAQNAAYLLILELFEDPAQVNEQNVYLLDKDQRDWGTEFAFFQVNDRHIRWTRAEPAAAERFGVGTANYDAFVALWDDIALSDELGTGWARVEDFGDGQDLDEVADREIDLLDFMYDRRPSFASPFEQRQFYLGGGVDDEYSGMITTSDLTTFAGFVRLKLLSPSVIEFLDPDHNIINQHDINDVERLDFLIDSGLPTEALGREFEQLAIGLGLIDENFDVRDMVALLQKVGLVFAIAGVVVSTGGTSAAGLSAILFRTAIAAEGTGAILNFSIGEYDAALLDAVFLIFDVKELATASKKILDVVQEPVQAIGRAGLRSDGVVAALRAQDYGDVADVIRLWTVDTPLTSGGDLALLEKQLRPEMFDRLRRAHIQEGGIVAPQMTEAQARAYLDGAFGQARLVVGDDANYLRVTAALESRDGAVEAYARFGERIFNPDGSLVDDLVEFGRSCKVAASFGAATLVVMADGSRRRIDTVSVGDQVLVWDIDAGTTVVETVTATLPHTDTLYTAYLSDGSELLVTEDRLFFDAAANSWIELADFDGGQMLSPGGVTVGLDEFEWSTSGPSQAYDLTVSDQHNYFVAADMSSTPVLVHNANSGWTCGRAAAHLIDADPSLAGPLKALDDALDPAVADELGAVVADLAADEADFLLLTLARLSRDVGPAATGTVATRVGRHPKLAAVVLDRGIRRRTEAFVGRLYSDVAFDAIQSPAEVQRVVERLSLGPGAAGWADEPAERFVARVIESRGSVVERRPYESIDGAGKQADAWIVEGDLVRLTDFKSYSGSSVQTLSKTMRDAAKQGPNVVLDLRGSPLGLDEALDAVRDAARRRFDSPTPLDSVELIGVGDASDLRVVWSRDGTAVFPPDSIVVFRVEGDIAEASTFRAGSVVEVMPRIQP